MTLNSSPMKGSRGEHFPPGDRSRPGSPGSRPPTAGGPIRNFSIIAHIDHGKSTLADRLMELTGALAGLPQPEQALDDMELERERGITIKASAVRLNYQDYVLNLIDTPGHVDFSYEVSRSLAACEGAILVVDAVEGIQAQTIANFTLATSEGLTIVPVVNKIDLPSASPEVVASELQHLCHVARDQVIFLSAKTGEGVEELLQAIIARIPPPQTNADLPLKALVFDSSYDEYRGVVANVRVFQGTFKPKDRILFMASKQTYEVQELGVFTPRMTPTTSLRAGEVGYVIAGIRDIAHARVGDTITSVDDPAREPLPGYRPAKPMVFCGLYTQEAGKFEALRSAFLKLSLNDASFTFEPHNSPALGFGFRCGFLGLLHMDIVQERLEREHNIPLIATAPSVAYQIVSRNGRTTTISNPDAFVDPGREGSTKEPFVLLTATTPAQFVGPCMELAQSRRGEFKNMTYHVPGNSAAHPLIQPQTYTLFNKVTLEYEMPLSEILFDFFEQLKARTSGFASYDYEFLEFRTSNLVKLSILVNKDPVDALSCILHQSHAYQAGKKILHNLKKSIPRQLFEVDLQAAIGSKVIAAERVTPLRKDVTAKLYGGDVTRKNKLRDKQKAGKKRMKKIGKVQLPQEAFLSILQIRE